MFTRYSTAGFTPLVGCFFCDAMPVLLNIFAFLIHILRTLYILFQLYVFSLQNINTSQERCNSHFNTLRTGNADLRFLHYNCARRMTQICVFNTRLFSLHNTFNYAIHRACLRMVLLTDVYINLTSL